MDAPTRLICPFDLDPNANVDVTCEQGFSLLLLRKLSPSQKCDTLLFQILIFCAC